MAEMMTLTRTLGVAALSLSLIVLGGCTDKNQPTSDRTETTSVQPDEIRHDLEPLTKRFAALGQPVSASWIGGTKSPDHNGRTDLPGPSSYWLEAVIELDPAVANSLRTKHINGQPSQPTQPDVKPALQSLTPKGTYFRSDSLDAALTANNWYSKAFLLQDHPTLVLTSFQP
ncbi:hypothetical protein BKG78_21335 [Mycobacteroides chelonae]|nr:hypothetical protein BKG78_21335 [Mycobacteroides chelonae]